MVMPHVSTVVSAARDMLAIWQMGNRVAGGPGGQQPQPQMVTQPQQSQPGMGGPMLVQSQPQPQFQPQFQSQSQPDPQPQPVTPPAPGLPTFGLNPQVAELLNAIKISFLNHLEGAATGELNGGHFADWFIGGFGDQYYKMVTQFGEEALLGAVYAYPPIAEHLAQFGQEKVKAFVHEFMTYTPPPDEGEGENADMDTDTNTPPSGNGAA